ncbi:MAG TPA: class I SAM-dependent methyltransferase, partial [Polyangiaceae bacterium]
PACARSTEAPRVHEQAADSRSSQPQREPDVPYQPSPQHVVEQMVKLAELRSGDIVYDLGCGDGRIVIAAVATPGVRGVCVDIDPERIRESRENARAAGVYERIEFRTEDLFHSRIADATVVMLFLWPEVNLKLRPKLERELAPGTRIISYMHDMGEWLPERRVEVRARRGPSAVYRWTLKPHAKDAG